MRKLLSGLLFSFSVILGFAQSTTSSATTNSTVSNQNISLSFVQTSPEARLIQSNGNYKLLLYSISPYISYFVQRPGSNAGLALMTNFIAAWAVGDNSFAAIPPNAVLTAGIINDQPNDANEFYLLKLANPRYDSKINAVEYAAVPLQGQNIVLNDTDLKNVTLVIN